MINVCESAGAPWVKNKIKIRGICLLYVFFPPSFPAANKFDLRWADFHLETPFENKLRRPQVCLIWASRGRELGVLLAGPAVYFSRLVTHGGNHSLSDPPQTLPLPPVPSTFICAIKALKGSVNMQFARGCVYVRAARMLRQRKKGPGWWELSHYKRWAHSFSALMRMFSILSFITAPVLAIMLKRCA